MQKNIFPYTNQQLEYLKQKDTKLAQVINSIGIIARQTDSDLFSAVIHHIVAQQISTKAQQTIWEKLNVLLGKISAEKILSIGEQKIQNCGLSLRKVQYIMDFSYKIVHKKFDLDAIEHMSDENAIRALSTLNGIGVWTAEMILLFCLKRQNIFSFSDLAIHRGLRMVYHHRKIDKKLFEKYRKRFSPYGSIASLYLWAVAGGAIAEMKDYAPANLDKKAKKANKTIKQIDNAI